MSLHNDIPKLSRRFWLKQAMKLIFYISLCVLVAWYAPQTTKHTTRQLLAAIIFPFSSMPSNAEEKTFDIKPYREFVISTTSFQPQSEDVKQRLLSDQTVLSDFWATVSPSEQKQWPNALRWNIPANVLGSLGDNIMHESKIKMDSIAAIPKGEQTYANTLGTYEAFDRVSTPFFSSLDFVSDVSPNKELRDAANDIKEVLSSFFIAQASRVDIYESVKAFSQTTEAQQLTGEYSKMLEDTLREFRRQGMELPDKEREELVEINTKLAKLGIKFQQNLGEENTTFLFTKEDLRGLNDDQLSALQYNEKTNEYTVTLKTPDYIPVMQYCENPVVREKLEAAYNSRCIVQNTPIIEEMVLLRAQAAHLLGYDTHADFVLEPLMAKSKENVMNFLQDLNQKLDPLWEKDGELLLQTKQRIYKERSITHNENDMTRVEQYDRAFLGNIIKQEQYSVDPNKVKEFFPLQRVLDGMFDLYQNLFGIRFVLNDIDTNSELVWHPDVKLFNVYDATNGQTNNDILLGQFYLDIHPREGKYGHAAVFPLVPSYKDETQNNKRIPAVCAVVCNFPKPTATKPALIPHDDVVTFLHEMGHALHHIFSQTQLTKYSGTNTLRDFVECPSQFLENYCWKKESLLKLMSHYETNEAPSDELLNKLIASKNCLQGAFYKRQLVFGICDQLLHTNNDTKIDTAAIYSQTMYDVMKMRPTPKTNMISSFGHLAGGYDAQYYGYMMSLSYAQALFDKFEQDGFMRQEVGVDYRNKILSKGGSVDPNELLKDFLGAPPSNEPFLRSIGL